MTDQVRPAPPATFLITKEYHRFVQFCDACRRYRYIGLCYGPSGVGKTLSARRYAQWDLLEPVLVPNVVASSVATPLDITTCRSVLYTPSVTTTPKRLSEQVGTLSRALSWEIEQQRHPDDPDPYARWRVNWTELLLVDEADRLKLPALEELRDHFDRGQMGLILIGMPGLEKRLARYAQFYSRVGFVHEFRVLGGEDLRFALAWQWQRLGLAFDPDNPNDVAAMAAAIRITGGNFRLVERLFAQVERILQINKLGAVTTQVVETARESLVIGPV